MMVPPLKMKMLCKTVRPSGSDKTVVMFEPTTEVHPHHDPVQGLLDGELTIVTKDPHRYLPGKTYDLKLG